MKDLKRVFLVVVLFTLLNGQTLEVQAVDSGAPDSSELIKRAQEFERTGNTSAALVTYKQLAENYPSQRYRYARFLSKQGLSEQAIEQYKIYYAQNPDNINTLRQISELYAKTSQFQGAIAYAEEYLTSVSNMSLGYHRVVLNLWDKGGGVDQAHQHYKSMLEDEEMPLTKVVIANLILGDIEFSRKNITLSRSCYRAALDKISPPANQWQRNVHNYVLREIFISRNWFDDAIASYKNLPDHAVLLNLGEHLKRRGRGFEMLGLYCDYLLSGPSEQDSQEPLNPPYIYNHAELAQNIINEIISVGEGESLIKQFNVRIAEQPENFSLHRNLGYMLFKMKRYEDGLHQLENFLALKDEPLAMDYQWIGGLCETAGMIEQAIRFYEIAAKMEVTNEDIRRESMMSQRAASVGSWKARFKARILGKLGNLYMKQKRWADAEACFEEIVELDARWYKKEAQTKLAQIWEQMGKENVFIRDLKEEIAQDPCDVELRIKYARTLLNAKKTSEAVEQCEQAVKLSPEDLSLRLRLAEALAEDNQNEKAIAEYKKALFAASKKEKDEFQMIKGGDETEPRQILNQLVRFCQKLGEKDKLLELYKEVLELLDSPDVRWQPNEYVLKDILREMTKIYEAKDEYSAIVELWLDYHKETTYYSRNVIQKSLRYLDSLQPFIEQMKDEVTSDPNDYWGRFILGDMLVVENRQPEALEIYTKLLQDVPIGSRVHHDLVDVFEHMKRYDLILEACKKELGKYEEGGRDYARRLGRIAEIYLKLDNDEKAAEFYRKAISCDISKDEYEKYQEGLFKATSGKEGVEHIATVTAEPIVDLDAMRLQAESLLNRNKDYNRAAELYEQILQKAPTDVRSMVSLGKAYEKLNRKEDALRLYEKAYSMRKWSYGQLYNVDYDLERIYRETGADEKLLSLWSDQRNCSEIRRYYQSRGEPEKYEQYLIEQIKESNDTSLRLYLGMYYLDSENLAAAATVFEQLRSDLVDSEGKVKYTSNVLNLARGFERLGKFDKALAILPTADYENDPDSSGWLGELLMRLYAKAGQFKKALEICSLRLKKHTDEQRIIKIAEQIAEFSQNYNDDPKLFENFLEEVKGNVSERSYHRFRGAVMAYLNAHPLPAENIQPILSAVDPVVLLKQGRRVQVPQNCRSFAQFLEKLAFQTDTVATQSFMGRYGQRKRPPRISIESGPAFEVLAAALDGTDIPMEITQDGYWAFFEAGDKSRKLSYAASGGLLCKFEGFNRKDDRPYLWALGRVLFEPAIQKNIASIQAIFEVTEAVDNKGRKVPITQLENIHWNAFGQIEIHLDKQQPPAKSIKKLRVKTAVAVATKWATFRIDRLDHSEPIVVEKDGIRIQLKPIQEIKWGRKQCWQIPIDIQRENITFDAKGMVELKDEVYFITNDSKKQHFGYSGTFPSGGHAKIAPRCDVDAFDPATTSLSIREPAAIEIVPFELTFHNIPIIQR